MKLKHVAVCLSVFAIFAISFSALAENKAEKTKLSNSEKAKMILEKAKTSDIAFIKKSVKETKRNGVLYKSEITEWKKFYPDGTNATRIFLKSFVNGKVSSETIRIKPIDGSDWTIIENIAIKNEYFKKQVEKTIGKNDEPKNKKYLLETSKFKEIPCYKITVTYSDVKESDSMMKKIYYIGKKDFFTYNIDFFMKNGKKEDFPVSNTLEKLENSKVDDGLFQIPKQCKIFKVDSLEDYLFINNIGNVKQQKRINPKKGAVLEKMLLEEYDVSDIDQLFNQKYR